MTENPKIKEAYGIYIDITMDTLADINKLMLSDAEKKVEVLVKFLGVEKEFTLQEFLNKLGI